MSWWKQHGEGILAGFIFVVGVSLISAFLLFFPYLVFFVSHTWDAASRWDCEYSGGSFVATSSPLSGLTHECVFP